MANLIATGTSSFTAAASWQAVDSTSELDSEAGSTAVSTATLDSATFTPGTITVDGIAVKLAARAASPSGTFTVTLRNNTSSLNVDSVTVNVSDLPASGLGWVFFKFSSTHLLLGATLYDVRVVCSTTGSQVTLFTNGTANNWSRKIRTTTTQAPAAGNHLVICNELTGAGTSNTVSIIMDNTATTSFGPTVSGGPPQGIVVSGGGTLSWATAASTAYFLKWKGVFLVTGGGTVNVGSSGTRMPASSSATLFMDCVADRDSGLQVQAGGTWNSYGATKNPYTLLTVDKAIGATIITLASTTGWQNGDTLGFSPTGTTVSQFEKKVISTVDSSTQVTLSTGLTNAHSGTSPIAGWALNLNRNILFRGASTSLRGDIKVLAAWGTVVWDSCEFTMDMLLDQTNGNSTLYLANTTNSVTLTNCSFNPSTSGAGSNIPNVQINGATVNNFTLTNCVSYDWSSYHVLITQATSGTNWTITGWFALGGGGSNLGALVLNDMGGTFTNNICSGNSTNIGAMIFSETAAWEVTDTTKFSGNSCNVNASGLAINANGSGNGFLFNLLNLTLIRNTGNGILITSPFRLFSLDTLNAVGNGQSNNTQTATIRFSNSTGGGIVLGYNWTISGDTTATSFYGVSDDSNTFGGSRQYYLYNCTFGVASGIRNAFSSGDFAIAYPGSQSVQVYANNCNFASTTNMSNLTNALQQSWSDMNRDIGSYIRAQNWGQTAGDHRTFTPQGNIKLDTAIFHTASPSERLTPNSASFKLVSGHQIASCGSGTARVFSAWVRTSTSTDSGGANYSGNAPRMMLIRNDVMGATNTTVLATHTATTGVWAQISGTCTTALEDGAWEAYVDCDGTAGWVNLDDWTAA